MKRFLKACIIFFLFLATIAYCQSLGMPKLTGVTMGLLAVVGWWVSFRMARNS